MDAPPDFRISDKCCDYAKKAVSKEFEREYSPDLIVNGMRRAEGGRRAGSVQTCFTPSKGGKPDNYRPLWFWTDDDKAAYKEWRGLRYSDCDSVY
jgi:3'-phosphoadenosine 5'-phosphosulfate sulfotransferase (PAPS reductase)/FAD synthetase